MRVTVAVHVGEIIKPKTLQSILKQAGLSMSEFRDLLEEEAKMRTYTSILEPDLEAGGYTVTVPAPPGCFTQGETVEECLTRAKEAIEGFIESLRADGEPVPEESRSPQILTVQVAA